MRSRLPLLAASILLLAGCGDPQPAEPISKTVTYATLIGAAYVAVVAGGWWMGHAMTLAGPRQPVESRAGLRVIALVVLGALAAMPVVPTIALLHHLAVGYSEEHIDVFTFADTVWITAVLTAFGAVFSALHLRAAMGAMSGRWWPRILLGSEGAIGLYAASQNGDPRWWLVCVVGLGLAAALPIAPKPPRLDWPAPSASEMLSPCR